MPWHLQPSPILQAHAKKEAAACLLGNSGEEAAGLLLLAALAAGRLVGVPSVDQYHRPYLGRGDLDLFLRKTMKMVLMVVEDPGEHYQAKIIDVSKNYATS